MFIVQDDEKGEGSAQGLCREGHCPEESKLGISGC